MYFTCMQLGKASFDIARVLRMYGDGWYGQLLWGRGQIDVSMCNVFTGCRDLMITAAKSCKEDSP
jgi:hypothetical protein